MKKLEIRGNRNAWRSIRAIAEGVANEGQQKEALKYIIHELCQTYHPSFSETERETAYAEGRRYVGLALVEILNTRGSDGKSGTDGT